MFPALLGVTLRTFLVLGTDPHLDHPNRLALMQAGLGFVGIHYPHGFRPVLRVAGL